MQNNSGWVSIHRQIKSHWLWKSEPFSKAQAWIDLIIHANHSPAKVLIKGTLVNLEAGDQCRSQVTLAAEWGWSRDKVRRFLDALESDQMIRQQTSQATTVISICNYSSFQQCNTADDTADKSPKKHQTDSRQDTNNNNKQLNNKNTHIPFDDFWNIYPRKTDKQKAIKAWAKVNPSIELFEQIKNNIQTVQVFKDPQYIPHATTYLNNKRWEDIEPMAAGQAIVQPIKTTPTDYAKMLGAGND